MVVSNYRDKKQNNQLKEFEVDAFEEWVRIFCYKFTSTISNLKTICVYIKCYILCVYVCEPVRLKFRLNI